MSGIQDRKVSVGELVNIVNGVIDECKKAKDEAAKASLMAEGGINSLHVFFNKLKETLGNAEESGDAVEEEGK